jgi:hypothetical protein
MQGWFFSASLVGVRARAVSVVAGMVFLFGMWVLSSCLECCGGGRWWCHSDAAGEGGTLMTWVSVCGIVRVYGTLFTEGANTARCCAGRSANR